ncbi:hypothetical protein AB3X91_39105 [Paraburkholderia sp. BR14263]|uniref:hypothetical protein n=1 Tax=unclassified Paraburkholderia TaxID=2615204 RepID=UPI0034CF495D
MARRDVQFHVRSVEARVATVAVNVRGGFQQVLYFARFERRSLSAFSGSVASEITVGELP